jgi:hemerythrin-like domain-containing protein
LIKTVLTGTFAGFSGLSLLSGCSGNMKETEISPLEDLMREHGLLQRILLIYDTCRNHLINSEHFPNQALTRSAAIIRDFVENYHEKLEEDYVFPCFEKVNQLTDLVKILRQQHKIGRMITDRIKDLSVKDPFSSGESQHLITLLKAFNNMYRPHASREDTVLFPALGMTISRNEFNNLGEIFENKEHQLFGSGGFETMVERVEAIEKQLNIYDLSKFNPSF